MSFHTTDLAHVPVYFPIPGGLQKKKTIYVRATPTGDRFEINLQCHAEAGCNIPFHFNPRVPDGDVVRNTYVDGAWQDEERDGDFFPFNIGEPCQVTIYIAKSAYEVSINGRFFGRYAHRVAPEEVHAIGLEGDAVFHELTVFDKLKTPYVSGIPGGMCCGKGVRVRGLLKPGADRFDVNFHPDNDTSGDHILHVNPRVGAQQVVRNAKVGGEWGEEETDGPDFPFKEGELFTMDIVCLEDFYRVDINNQPFTVFPHRCGPDAASFVSITGDVEVAECACLDAKVTPHMQRLEAPLKVGDAFTINGTPTSSADRIELNLFPSDERMGDCILHVNPRFSQGAIVFNAKLGGDWGDEEQVPMPAELEQGKPFKAGIVVANGGFEVYFGQTLVHTFGHRGYLGSVTHAGVEGDAFFHYVRHLPAVAGPILSKIPGSVRKGRWIQLGGRVNPDADRFEVNLQCSGNAYPDCQIALHFNPRLGDATVVRNTYVDGGWQEEEREQPFFPFMAGKPFELLIFVDTEDYKFFVNGHRYASFPHRLPHYDVCHVNMEGHAVFYPPRYN